jgi:hypothetical protein
MTLAQTMAPSPGQHQARHGVQFKLLCFALLCFALLSSHFQVKPSCNRTSSSILNQDFVLVQRLQVQVGRPTRHRCQPCSCNRASPISSDPYVGCCTCKTCSSKQARGCDVRSGHLIKTKKHSKSQTLSPRPSRPSNGSRTTGHWYPLSSTTSA